METVSPLHSARVTPHGRRRRRWRWRRPPPVELPPGGAAVAERRGAGRRGWALTPSSGPRRRRAAVTWALPSAGLRGTASQSGSKSPAQSRRGLGHRRTAAPGAGLAAGGGEAAGRTRAPTATATAGAGGSGPEQGKESGGGCRRRNGGRILAPRARPPLLLAAAPDAEWGRRQGRRTQDPLPWPLELPEFGRLQLLALWGSGSVFGCLPFSSGCLETQAPVRPPPSRAHPAPPGSGPARTRQHEETWDMPGDFGRTFANCGRGDVFR